MAQENHSGSPRLLIVGDRGLADATVDLGIQIVHDCEFAATVPAALATAATDEFAAVALFGLDPGGVPDLDLLRSLVEAQRDAAVVVVSAVADPALAERAFAEGAHSYLLAPLSPRQLEISISGHLRQRRAERRTERRRSQDLRVFQARAAEMMGMAPAPIFVKDRRGRYIFANQHTHRCLGIAEGELIGKRDDEVLPAEVAAEVMAADRRVIEDGEPFATERTVTLFGQPRTYVSNRFPFLDTAGAIVGVIGMGIDITDRKTSEARRAAFEVEQRRLVFELQSAREETADRLSRALYSRDPESGEHVSRMAIVCAHLGARIGLEPEEVILLRAAAPMHDIGKIAIPDGILRKRGPLTKDERALMERHTTIGFEMLGDSASEALRLGATIALTHHERYDGSGYPRGLRGEEIPIEGRVAAVADVFDALLAARPYRPALGRELVREMIAAGRGTQFDPQVVDALLDDFETALALRNADGEVSGDRIASFVAEPFDRAAVELS
jgi:PAS domain S-box-containing protein